jgi:hypothetical protein
MPLGLRLRGIKVSADVILLAKHVQRLQDFVAGGSMVA